MSYVAVDYDVATSSGIAQGYKNNILYWDDIPCAKPPIDELRWKDQDQLINLKNCLQKIIFCVQRPSSLGGASGDGIYVGTEDCLYLDIAAPANKKSELIGYVLIHGGGNTSGLKDLYDFSKMAKKHDVPLAELITGRSWMVYHSFKNFKQA